MIERETLKHEGLRAEVDMGYPATPPAKSDHLMNAERIAQEARKLADHLQDNGQDESKPVLCSVQLPPENKPVLGWCADEECYTVCWRAPRHGASEGSWDWCFQHPDLEGAVITHWVKLPPAPKEGERL